MPQAADELYRPLPTLLMLVLLTRSIYNGSPLRYHLAGRHSLG